MFIAGNVSSRPIRCATCRACSDSFTSTRAKRNRTSSSSRTSIRSTHCSDGDEPAEAVHHGYREKAEPSRNEQHEEQHVRDGHEAVHSQRELERKHGLQN